MVKEKNVLLFVNIKSLSLGLWDASKMIMHEVKMTFKFGQDARRKKVGVNKFSFVRHSIVSMNVKFDQHLFKKNQVILINVNSVESISKELASNQHHRQVKTT